VGCEALLSQETSFLRQWKRHISGIRVGNRDPDFFCRVHFGVKRKNNKQGRKDVFHESLSLLFDAQVSLPFFKIRQFAPFFPYTLPLSFARFLSSANTKPIPSSGQ